MPSSCRSEHKLAVPVALPLVISFGLVFALPGTSGCGGPATPAIAPAAAAAVPAAQPSPGELAELSPALAPLSWWLGAWQHEDGHSEERWIAADGALYGVSLEDSGAFEVLIVNDGLGRGAADGELRLFALPNGAPEVRFSVREQRAQGVTFSNEAHDFPNQIRYDREGDLLAAEISGQDRTIPFRFRRVAVVRAPELEAADVAFSADVAVRGVEAWMAAFEPGGWIVGDGDKLAGDGMRARMTPFFAQVSLSWAPLASGRRGDLGFTVGKATFAARDGSAAWRGTYVTLWHRQPDGSWKVRFDVGRPVQQ